ncbi:MAG: dehypoxanthine futalosine cyclase [Actinomycetota bacterium]|nr:dehypoxanthine futalosine cyclase [Actinomycetota bacterium]
MANALREPVPVELADLLAHAADGGRIDEEQALLLYERAPFHELGQAADSVRRRRYPDGRATFIIERNVNYTNKCVTACKFCAFYAAPKSAAGWAHDWAEIDRRVDEAVAHGACQIMFQGGHNPEFGIEYYEELFGRTRRRHPELFLHALGGSEIIHISRTSGIAVEETITRLVAAGLSSLAGAGAEILPSRPRKLIAPLKESGSEWLEVMETAHRLGVQSTATLMMGTVETPAERFEHLRMIRDVQDRTGGFRAFIHWSYQAENNTLKGQSPSVFEYLRVLAVARLFFDNIAHIQGSWLTVGKEVGQLSLHFGADDLGSIMLEENVVSAAGAKHRTDVAEMIHLIRTAGRVPAQRNTLYEIIATFDEEVAEPRVVGRVPAAAIAR